MSGGLTEVTGWSEERARAGARDHVEAVLAQGGFARIVPLGDGRVVWLGPDDRPWRHIPRAVLPSATERKLAEMEARRQTSEDLAQKRRDKRSAAGKAATEAKRAAKAAAKEDARRRAAAAAKRRPSWQAATRSGPVLSPSDMRRARKVLKEVSLARGLALADLLQRDRRRVVAHARFEAAWRVRELRAPDGRRLFTLPRIGRLLGLDHTSVLHGLRRHARLNGLDIAPDLIAAPERSRAA